MNICLGFFGFIRKIINKDEFIKFIKLLPLYSNIDIFISSPSQYGEIENNVIDYESFKLSLKEVFNCNNIHIKLYNYNPFEFIKKVRTLNLPDYIEDTRCFPFRVISQHYSISMLCKNIYEHIIQENKQYDNIILTRFDILPTIESFGDCLIRKIEDSIHIIRTIPYYLNEHAEDRIILTSKLGLEKLKNLYNIYEPSCYKQFNIENNKFIPEYILYKYLNTFNDLLKLPQIDIIIGMSPYINNKYNNNYYFNKLLKHEADTLILT